MGGEDYTVDPSEAYSRAYGEKPVREHQMVAGGANGKIHFENLDREVTTSDHAETIRKHWKKKADEAAAEQAEKDGFGETKTRPETATDPLEDVDSDLLDILGSEQSRAGTGQNNRAEYDFQGDTIESNTGRH
jgi:hypothetical protein